MIYLDYNATTPVDERVISKILPFFSMQFGNAASAHPYGRKAHEAVENARSRIARSMGADPSEIIFTSGATESCNLAIKGVLETYRSKGRHIITVTTEHPAVLDTCKWLEQKDAELTYLPVNSAGMIDLKVLETAIRPDTVLVAVMVANNETGVIQPFRRIGELCHKKGVLFFTDATQALGKLPIHVLNDNIDLMAFSGHKIYAPKGIGGLYVRRKNPRVRLSEQIHGGGHEKAMRSGTLNVPDIVGLAEALSICKDPREVQSLQNIQSLRDRLEHALTKLPGVQVNTDRETPRLGHVSNLRFEGTIGRQLLGRLNPDIAVSSGSACSTASNEPSHVLLAMGLSEDQARSSIRFSLGRFTTEQDITTAILKVTDAVRDLSGR
ncbi:cysteine desulfurase family protein [Arachidicoccus terrestris]|uniref:cysteine desulfurase family protein n=1 Tax=Arachidicoccus terrestris TaxID=2875539 RepID=UPI001CC3D240|nr:cysteine desulfurase family protein [Arachidicoccus terrestris]UAY54613.1 cysteine desulfurase [Arachidicoccus terrestris]